MRKVSLMVDSASRPDFLGRTFLSIKEKLKFSGRIQFLYHETFIDMEKSNECIQFMKENCLDCEILIDYPQGQGYSITRCLEQTKEKYFLYWVDDHSLVRELNLDMVYSCMEENFDINQIVFNKRKNGLDRIPWTVENCEVEKSGQKLFLTEHWRYGPSIWRVDWIKSRWVCWKDHNHHWLMNNILQAEILNKKNPNLKTELWAKENLGTYYLGGFREPAYVENIGYAKSQRDPSYNGVLDAT